MTDTPEDQAEAAAEEAGAIGGPDPMPDVDPGERAVAEGGGGEAEGFEQAEDELIRQASHEDNLSDPASDAFTPEVESDRSTAAYGEADEAKLGDADDDDEEDS